MTRSAPGVATVAVIALAGVTALVAACGGSAPAPAAQSPANTSTSPDYVAPESATPSDAHATTSPEIASTRAEIDRAEQRLAAAQSDCAEACRALASMERAANHLCALDSGSECARVRERVDAARERVRSTCGECAR